MPLRMALSVLQGARAPGVSNTPRPLLCAVCCPNIHAASQIVTSGPDGHSYKVSQRADVSFARKNQEAIIADHLVGGGLQFYFANSGRFGKVYLAG